MIFKFEDIIINLKNVCYVQFYPSAIKFQFNGETDLSIYPKDDYETIKDEIETALERQSNNEFK